MVNRPLLRLSLIASLAGSLCLTGQGRAQSETVGTDDLSGMSPVVGTENLTGTADGGFGGPLTVLGSERLKDSTVSSMRDLTASAPNFTVADANGDRTPRFVIRGLRENNFSAGEAAVGIYLDDVPYTDMSSRGALLYDISEVRILRGPRGTEFGAARPGGLIDITTRQPGNQWRGYGQLTYGNYDAVSVDAGASGPIAKDSLFFGVSGIYSERNGFFENTFLGTHPDDRQTLGGLVQLRYQPAEHWNFTLIASGNRSRDGYIPAVSLFEPDPFSIRRNYDGHADTDSYNLALKAAYERETVRAVSVTTYRNWRQDILQGYDFISGGPATLPVGRLGFTKPELRQIAEELRFQSNDRDAAFKWTGGGYFADLKLDGNSGTEELLADGVNRTTYWQTGRDYALFGQGAYRFVDRFEVMGGLRYEFDDRRMTRSHAFETALGSTTLAPDYDLADSWDSLQPRLTIALDAAPNSTVYTTVARGYQSGGFNPSSDIAAELRYDKSESWTYEIGTRLACFENALVINASVFYTDTVDYQVFRPTPTPFASNYQVMNAESAHALGAELEVVYQPVERLELDAAFGYTYAQFDTFVNPYSAADYSGNRINLVPELMTTFGAQYKCSFGLLTRIETQIIGDTWFDEGNTVRQQAYAVLNARIGYEKDDFGIYLFGRNLTDQRYFSNALDFGADYGGQFFGTPGDPATYGVAIMGRF